MNEQTKRVLRSISNARKFLTENGGRITFRIKQARDGWTAVCNEQTALMTGGNERKPNETVMKEQILELLHDVFDIPDGVKVFEFIKEHNFLPSPYQKYLVKDTLEVCEQ